MLRMTQKQKMSDQEMIEVFAFLEEGAKPKPFAFKYDLNYSKVKSQMNRLAKKGALLTDFHNLKGNYGLNPEYKKITHGLNFKTEPKIQNLVISCKNCGIPEKINIIHKYPTGYAPQWKKQITVGEKRNLTIWLNGEMGFDISTVIILTEEIYLGLNEKYNINLTPENLFITNIEEFNDLYGITLATPNSFSFSDLLATYKIYNKKNRVRCEIRANPYLSLALFYKNLDNVNYFLAHSSQLDRFETRLSKLDKVIYSNLEIQKRLFSDQRIKQKDIQKRIEKLEFISADKLSNDDNLIKEE